MRAHVKKDDGRLQAYGWSLPAKSPPGPASKLDADQPKISTPNVPVPVPVYCRPLMEKEPGMKVRILRENREHNANTIFVDLVRRGG